MTEKTKFHGTVDELQALVEETGTVGNWNEDGDSWSFRSRDKAVLKWWPGTGTLTVQGPQQPADRLRQAVVTEITTSNEKSSPHVEENVQVFIVHGHDRDALAETKLILFELGLRPYILQESSGEGKTIIEALEQHLAGSRPRAAFGIVLLTPDDIGASLKDGVAGARPRARQNVVLEMGMLIASLGRSKALILVRG